jgi:5-hydroxyisourate hydrolase-like protein (transthyretin family)
MARLPVAHAKGDPVMKTRLLTLALLVSLAVLVTIVLSETSPTTAQSTMSGSNSPVLQVRERSDLPQANLEPPPVIIRGQVVGGQADLRVQVLASDGGAVDETRTGPDGEYRFPPLPSGHYKLRVLDERGRPLALTQDAQVEITPERAQARREYILPLAVPVSRGDSRSTEHSLAPTSLAQPASVQADGYITGVVTAADTGLPQWQLDVNVYNDSGELQTSGFPDYFTGVYSVAVPPDTYRVEFAPYGSSIYAPEWYNNQHDFASATPIVVGDGAVMPNINASLDVGGQIAGRVTAAVGGTPLASVYVYAYTSTTSASWDYVASDSTDASGIYTITGLLTGTYYLKFDPPYGSDYLVEYYNDKRSLATADPIPVTLGGVVSGKDAALETGGKIAGRVTATVGSTPLQGVYVYAYTSTTSTNYVAYDSTDASGIYTITRLLTGTYYLQFEPPYGSDYLPEYYDDKRSLGAADPIPVTLGSVISGKDAALETGGKITGRVTATVGSTPLQGVYVYAYTTTGTCDAGSVAYAYTDASGVYTITHLVTGTYYLEFYPSYGSDYLGEYYNDRSSLAAADGINVTLGSVVSGIDAALRTASKITGRATAVGSSTPLEDVEVTVYGYRCTCSCSFVSMGYATTNATGSYTVTGLVSGSYRIEFEPYPWGTSAAYLGEYYNDKASLTTADPVAVADGGVTSGIDAALTLGGQITGRVTATDGGGPLEDVWVDAYDSNGNYVSDGETGATGVYTIAGLPAGNYRLEFYPSSSGVSAAYLSEYYNNRPTLATADPVSVTLGGMTSNINAVLSRGGQITGQITAADGGAPLEDVYVEVYDSSGDWAGSAWTNAGGVYTTTGLATGSYRLYFSTVDYIGEYYNDKTSLATANPVNVTAPNLVGGINAVLARGGKISGRVTAADTGAPLSDVRVGAYDSNGTEVRSTYTDSCGNYTITGLPTGNYRVRFYGVTICADAGGSYVLKTYVGEYYSDKPSLATADALAVTAPSTVPNINAVLALSSAAAPVAGVTISGPTTGYMQTNYTFNATVSPVTATMPITYVWQATGQSPVTHSGGGLGDSVNFTWLTPGIKTITVTASNGLGTASNTHVINLSPPLVLQAPTSVTISGPTVGFTQTNLAFNAAVSPITATSPITYIWQATEQSAVTHTGGGINDSVSFTWATTGTKTITVTAANALGTVIGGYAVDISSTRYQVYLPVVMKP